MHIKLLVAAVLAAIWVFAVFTKQSPMEPMITFISTVLAALAGHLSQTERKDTPNKGAEPTPLKKEAGSVNLILTAIIFFLVLAGIAIFS